MALAICQDVISGKKGVAEGVYTARPRHVCGPQGIRLGSFAAPDHCLAQAFLPFCVPPIFTFNQQHVLYNLFAGSLSLGQQRVWHGHNLQFTYCPPLPMLQQSRGSSLLLSTRFKVPTLLLSGMIRTDSQKAGLVFWCGFA